MCGPFIVCFSWLCFNRRRRGRSILFHSFSFTFFVWDFCLLYEFKLSLINFVHVRSAEGSARAGGACHVWANTIHNNTQIITHTPHAAAAATVPQRAYARTNGRTHTRHIVQLTIHYYRWPRSQRRSEWEVGEMEGDKEAGVLAAQLNYSL